MTSNRRYLVAYATRYGATAGVAQHIATALERRGIGVEALPVSAVADLTAYEGVILGSPVYMGKWMPEAVRFLEENRDELKRVPFAIFTVGLLLRDKPEEGCREHEAAIAGALKGAPGVEPLAVGMFVGALDKSRMGFLHRLVMTLMRAPEGDFTDPEAVRRWTENLADHLSLGVGIPA